MIRGRRLGLITGGTCIVHPGTRAPEHPVTDLLSQNIRCVCHIALAEDWGLLPGEHVLFTPGHALQSTGRLLGPITGNTYAVYPGTRRSRGPCDMLAVKAHTVCY